MGDRKNRSAGKNLRVLFVWVKVEGEEPPTFLPLGIGYLAANLPKTMSLRVWDGMLWQEENEKVVSEEIKKFKPDVVAFSVWSFNFQEVKQTVELVKKTWPELLVILGGVAVSGYKEKVLEMMPADFGFCGEGEKSLGDFLKAVAKQRLTLAKKREINGLIWRDGRGEIVVNPVSWGELDDIRHCDYELINLRGYLKRGYSYSMHPKGTKNAPVLTTRGCPFSCKFCSARLVNGRVVRTRQVIAVINEIKELYERYGIRGFNIIDDNFTFNLNFAKQVCREILGLNLKGVSFASPNGIRFEFLDEELLSLMKWVGWRYLAIAPESGSRRTLVRMQKAVNLFTVRQKIKLIKQAGLKVLGYFIIGYPGETVEDIKKTIEFACKNGFDSVIFTCFKPLPGTPVYDRLIASGEISENLQEAMYYKITYAPKGLTVNQMRWWRAFAFFRFYTSSWERLVGTISSFSLGRTLVFLKNIMIK